jgi:UDP-glucose 4-epimerase
MKVLVTGASGYIGGQTAIQLKDQGHEVYGLDWARLPHHLHSLNLFEGFCQFDVDSVESRMYIKTIQPDAVVHCAGTSLVGPSMMNPEEYYNNNFVKTKSLLDCLRSLDWQGRFIFSSSAATYGNPIMTPICEVDPADPISPYGQSKLMIDWMLESYCRAYQLNFVSFRYFNACGADSRARHGQAPGATHIIARVLEAMRDKTTFTLNGTDYPTEDGTCVRDYVHVEDLAQAHIMAMDLSIPVGIYNLGTKSGTSNAQIIDLARVVTGQTIAVETGPQREGDPAVLTADPEKFMSVCTWRPEHDLYDIISHAWAWYNR